ncbi:unnamed protein product [Rhizophagus irregularis]|uniref:Uncharacterized protein n=1 Tax=Rhizophagus irregularis TaxID=588596 RepID=A0A2I1FWX8_9GLOM|nr:hypothetical protein RhiirA4_439642 [Rhizophagus irregularis]CAB4405015.1 unnamed protein product [Rhizophagus irregularis]
MSTPNHITHLIRLDNLCKDWSTIHSNSCKYFSSLINILTQRKDTELLLGSNNNNNNKIFDSFYINNNNSNLMPSSSISIGKNLPFFLQSQSLTLLIYKQSREIEEMLTKIHSVLQEFEEIINSMKNILNQSNKLINPNQTISSSPSLNSTTTTSISTTTTTTATTTKKQSSKKKKSKQQQQQQQQHSKSQKSSNKSTLNPQKKQIDLFDNFENPEDIADIPIITSNLYIVRIVEMYEKELCYKKNLIFGGCFNINHNDDFVDDDDGENGLSGGMNGVKLIGERWAAQPYLLFEMEEEMCDRIKVWKRVKEFGSIK